MYGKVGRTCVRPLVFLRVSRHSPDVLRQNWQRRRYVGSDRVWRNFLSNLDWSSFVVCGRHLVASRPVFDRRSGDRQISSCSSPEVEGRHCEKTGCRRVHKSEACEMTELAHAHEKGGLSHRPHYTVLTTGFECSGQVSTSERIGFAPRPRALLILKGCG